MKLPTFIILVMQWIAVDYLCEYRSWYQGGG